MNKETYNKRQRKNRNTFAGVICLAIVYGLLVVSNATAVTDSPIETTTTPQEVTHHAQ
ncbi:hypothetical protein N9137_03390 [Pseudomonadales bacterium]|nr:hypothetical protein [Pseudomonadales bacterium]